MALVWAGAASHSPILLKTIGKENTAKFHDSLSAYRKLALSLEAAAPDTLLIITPHGPNLDQACGLNIAERLTGQLADFSDLQTRLTLDNDLDLALRLKQALEPLVHLQLVSEPNLDYGAVVPLALLTKKLPKLKVLPLYLSRADLAAHYALGQALALPILHSAQKIAVLASVDLSHCLSKAAPGGYSAKAKRFDQKVLKAVQTNRPGELLALPPALLDEVKEGGARGLAVLLGILPPVVSACKLLSYQAPFGVGCPVLLCLA